MSTSTEQTTTDDGTTPVRLAVVIASVRATRFADALLPWLRAELAARRWLQPDLIDLRALAPDALAASQLAPGGSASPLSDRLAAADAFLIVTPEYNHSFPAALKHLLDWHFDEWARKPATFVSYGAGSGGIRAVEQLRSIFSELRATTTRDVVALSAPWESLDEDGRRYRPSDSVDRVLDATLDELRWWAGALRRARTTDRMPA